jgi:hypothetical protein
MGVGIFGAVHEVFQPEEVLADSIVPVDKGEIVAALAEIVPQFRHAQTGQSLDDRF